MKHFLYIFISLVLFSNPMFAQEEQDLTQDKAKHPLLTSKYYAEVGVFFPAKNIELGADGESSDGNINFGETFDLNDNQATPFLHLEWHWNKKWRLNFETFSVNNAARATLDSTYVFDGATFEEGSYVRIGVEFALYRIYVGRVISSGPKHSLGAGLGVHAINIGAFIEGEVKSNIEEIDGEFQKQRVSALIPLPNVGAWYSWAPNEKWFFNARVDWFGLTYEQYSGSLWDIAPAVKYQFIKNFGIGVDYRILLLNAKISQENWNGNVDMGFSGPTVTLHGNF